MPYFADRLVRVVPETENPPTENRPQSLQAFREVHAWVLLGEPGAGKSTAFKAEAGAIGGEYLRIAEFIELDLDDEWRAKTLFLDGLDEVRAGGDSTLIKIRHKLNKLGNPPFRLSCRAADWFGATDQASIAAAAADKKITVLLLEPLGDADVLDILRENHSIANPEYFVRDAHKRGIDGLLNNPQTLELLAKAVRGEQFPETRQETYQLACEKMAAEANKVHRDKKRGNAISVEARLEAAGQLCAVLLFANQTGIALDIERVKEGFIEIETCKPPDPDAAHAAIQSKLFRPAATEERVEPAHRTITEFLAARWLGQQIDQQGLPLKRVLNLLLGRDGRTVAGLRGLYAWLALECKGARTQLIQADPFSVVIYGDVSPMSIADKRIILQGLKQEAERFPAFRWQAQSAYPFGALAAKELIPDFIEALTSPDRSEATQSFADCVLEILAEGEAFPELIPTAKAVILDATRWDGVRHDAMRAWLKLGATDADALGLLDDITDGKVTDQNDDLAGALLRHLYPNYLPTENLLRYVHPPKQSNYTGSFVVFWGYELPTIVPPEYLPVLLDQLVQRTGLSLRTHFLSRMIGQLLSKAIELHGEHIAGEKLFAWLGVGLNEDGTSIDEQQYIKDWLTAHPERYKALLALCYQQCENLTEPHLYLFKCERRLYQADAPEDLGLWHQAQVALTNNDALAKKHLIYVVRPDGKSLSSELIRTMGEAHPKYKDWLDSLPAGELSERQEINALHKRQDVQVQAAKQKNAEKKHENSIALNADKDAIYAGQSSWMHHLAQVWLGHVLETKGKTPAERFNNFCDNGDEILTLAESGFRACVERADLPTVDEILALHTKQKQHFVRMPCLIGMELRWQDNSLAIAALPDDILRKMIAFRLTYSTDNAPAWFSYLVSDAPPLVADVLVRYAIATLNSKQDFVDGIYSLANDPSYRAVACLTVPTLLERFPLRARANQLQDLRYLLAAARLYAMPELAAIVNKKTMRNSMDVAQKVYWLTTAMLLDPTGHQAVLWKLVGKSQKNIPHLFDCLSNFSDSTINNLPAEVFGKLIELCAPHAELVPPSGVRWVSAYSQRGDYLRSLISRLGALATDQAAQELERLVQLPALSKLKFQLQAALHQLKLTQREQTFAFLSPAKVAQILANQAPISSADLAALALDYLDGVAQKIRYENDDYFRHFWTADEKHQDENTCRDLLLTRLREAFKPLNVDCQPEADYANDKRADIRLSYQNQFEVPIEVKGEWHPQLWKAAQSQLVQQYSIAPNANGYGIYLVLWFGGKGMPNANDGGKKPTSPEELKTRLEAQLNREERERIFIRVLDVTYPN